MKPNARCPVCGAAVYFYKNEVGSRVYFDEIGPPWPKHPCMAKANARGIGGAAAGRVTPAIYEMAEGRQILAEARRRDRSDRSRTLASSAPKRSGEAFILQGTWQNERGTLFHLQRLYERSTPEAWGSPEYVSLEAGQLVFIQDGYLSYLHIGQACVVKFPVYFQYRMPKEPFLQRLRDKFDR